MQIFSDTKPEVFLAPNIFHQVLANMWPSAVCDYTTESNQIWQLVYWDHNCELALVKLQLQVNWSQLEITRSIFI